MLFVLFLTKTYAGLREQRNELNGCRDTDQGNLRPIKSGLENRPEGSDSELRANDEVETVSRLVRVDINSDEDCDNSDDELSSICDSETSSMQVWQSEHTDTDEDTDDSDDDESSDDDSETIDESGEVSPNIGNNDTAVNADAVTQLNKDLVSADTAINKIQINVSEINMIIGLNNIEIYLKIIERAELTEDLYTKKLRSEEFSELQNRICTNEQELANLIEKSRYHDELIDSILTKQNILRSKKDVVYKTYHVAANLNARLMSEYPNVQRSTIDSFKQATEQNKEGYLLAKKISEELNNRTIPYNDELNQKFLKIDRFIQNELEFFCDHQ